MRGTVRDVALAILITAAATLVQRLIVVAAGTTAPFLAYWLGIVSAAYLRGRRSALWTLGLSVLVSSTLFIPPYGTLSLASRQAIVLVVAFAAGGSAVAWLGGALHAARDTAARRAALYRDTLDGFTSPFFSFDRDWRITFLNRAAAISSNGDERSFLGRSVWDAFPQLRGTAYETGYRECMATRQPVRFDAPGPVSGLWFEVTLFPTPDGIAGFMHDRSLQRRATEALVDADRQKDAFLGALSHELRTPLNVIGGWTQMLERRGDVLPDDVRGALTTISRNAGMLTRLVNDLVDVSAFTRGKVTLAMEPVALDRILADCVTQMGPLLRARGITSSVIVRDPIPLVRGDAQRLVQVVSNIFNNAAKFTGAGGSITTELSADDRRVRLRISDTGVGIEPSLLPFVFDPFRQGTERRTGPAGLGLGLAIARSIVTAHGGDITAASDGHNRGTTITIELPADAAAAAPERQLAGSLTGEVDRSSE